MKVFMLATAILSGWLYTEVKEFVVNGGLDNKLALIILKILFISIFIVVVGVFDINFKKFFDSEGFLSNKDNTASGKQDDDELKKALSIGASIIDSRARSFSKRKNKFNREHLTD